MRCVSDPGAGQKAWRGTAAERNAVPRPPPGAAPRKATARRRKARKCAQDGECPGESSAGRRICYAMWLGAVLPSRELRRTTSQKSMESLVVRGATQHNLKNVS